MARELLTLKQTILFLSWISSIFILFWSLFTADITWNFNMNNTTPAIKSFVLNMNNTTPQIKTLIPKEMVIYNGRNMTLASKFNSDEYIGKYSKTCRMKDTWMANSPHMQNIYSRENSRLKRFPRCICIGQAKAGTRATLEYLGLHPNIAAAMKETTFFANDKLYRKGFSAYLNMMPCSTENQMTIEKSPEYVAWWKSYTPQRILEFDPGIRLLFAVRDPIDRAVSEYLHFYVRQGRGHGKSFQELATTKDGKIKTSYSPIKNSLYDKVIDPWLKIFKREQIHIIDGDNLILHPLEEMKKMEAFLKLPPYYTNTTFQFNKEKGFYCLMKNGEMKCLGAGKGSKHPKLEKSFVKKLKAFYKPHNEQFYQMIGQQFHWD